MDLNKMEDRIKELEQKIRILESKLFDGQVYPRIQHYGYKCPICGYWVNTQVHQCSPQYPVWTCTC